MSSCAFIALQCYSCSTMQVKQRKKSNNKWTCVVCNEKQSLRHVFAQGHMAKDVRKFVQTFNMSRQFADQNCVNDEMVAPVVAEEVILGSQEKKRTDWSEYLDYEPEIRDEIEDVNEPKIVTELPTALFKKPKLTTHASRSGRENGENGLKPVLAKRKSGDISTTQEDVNEPKIVTELPTALFKKPKLSTHTSRSGSDNGGTGFKPVFSHRKAGDISTSQDKDPSKYQPSKFSKAPKWSENPSEEKKSTTSNWTSKSRTNSAQEPENFSTVRRVLGQDHSTSAQVFSKWSNYMVQDKKEELCEKEVLCPFRQAGKAKGVSKWDKYVTIEEDDDIPQPRGRIGISNRARHQVNDDGIFDVSLHDERVEEDVHPDFQ